MANTKIGALTAATAAIASHQYPVTEGGNPKRVSGQQQKAYVLLGMPWHNVLDEAYGALGNSNSSTGGGADDTAAIQAAYTAAAAGTACVAYPGGRTYRITSTITVPIGVHSVAISGRQNGGNGDPPTIVWDGSNGGTMFDVVDAGSGLFGTKFSGIMFRGGSSITNRPGAGIKFRPNASEGAKPDSGTVVEHCWFQLMGKAGSPGHGIHFAGQGATNFRMSGGRFDACAGYGVYVDLSATGSDFIGVFDQQINWVGGTIQGKGFMHLDGEAASSGGTSHVTFIAPHTEENQDMTDTWPSGVGSGLDGSGRTIYPSDKRGVVRLGVNPASGNLQHDIRVLGWDHSAGANSHCIFQVTSTSGTSRAAAACVSIQGIGAAGLNNFNGADTNDTGEVRLIGGNIPDDERWPHLGYRLGTFALGRGKISNYEGVRHYINSDLYTVRGLQIQGSTYANLSPVPVLGSMAIVTDANATTLHATVAAGGSNKMLVMHNGTNWITVANLT